MKRLIDYMTEKKALLENAKAPSYKDKFITAIRKKYSLDDELGILRQRDSKPEEFREHFKFVEKIKAELKKGAQKWLIM